MRPETVALGALARCPACGEAMLEPTPGDRWQRCTNCRSEFELEPWFPVSSARAAR